MTPSFLSVIPPLVAIAISLWTKQTYLSLLLALWSGALILSGDPLTGTLNTLNMISNVFKDEDNTRTIMFSALMGGLLLMMQKSGGVSGFLTWISKHLQMSISQDQDKDIKDVAEKNARKVRVWAYLTGVFIFIETTISSLVVGTVFRPLADQHKVSREALSYLADTTSAPTSVLLPFNAWGAFIMGLLAKQGISDGFSVLMLCIPLNFYAILSLISCFAFAYFNFEFGPMKTAGERVRNGQILSDHAKPLISDELSMVQAVDHVPHRAINMILPIFTMILSMPIALIYTGWPKLASISSIQIDQTPLVKLLFLALTKGSGSFSVLIAIVSALLVSICLYRVQGIFKISEMMDLILKGISELMPLALLMVFAFAMSSLCKELGTGVYVAQIFKNTLPIMICPALIFIIAAMTSFATGTSWGTFSILIPIAVPLANAFIDQSLQSADPISQNYLYLMIAAVLGGGVFGDHTSPISDTTIVSSMASASDHLDHVKTQLPYALVVALISCLLYLFFGFIFE